MNRSMPGLPVHHQLTSIESVMPSSHLILCRPLLLLPPIPPGIRVFPSELTLHMRWPKYWSFSFSISPSNEHPGLISCGMDLLDLLAVQGTLKSLLQHHSSKHQFFGARLSSHFQGWRFRAEGDAVPLRCTTATLEPSRASLPQVGPTMWEVRRQLPALLACVPEVLAKMTSKSVLGGIG